MLNLKKLLTKVLSIINGDGNWINLNSYVSYFKKSGIVTVTAYDADTSYSSAYTTIGTLPIGYRPSKMLYFSCFTVSSVNQVVGYVNTNGVIAIRTNSGTATNVGFTISFPVEA